jgi:hypothetical protein
MNAETQKIVATSVKVGQKFSWIDRLTIWIDHLPLPAWLFYLVLMVVGEFLFNLIFWIDGSVPFWQRVSLQSASPSLVILSVALYHYLTRVGSQSLQDFRPLLEVDEAEIAQIDFSLNYLPSWMNWILLILTVPGSVWYVFSSPNTFGEIVPQTILPACVVLVLSVIVVMAVYSQFFRIIRQVRILQDLYQRASNINLLYLEPAHAFARLTASTGGGLILLMVVGILYNPELATGVTLAGVILAVFFSILIFIVPLMGMRRRLISEKNQYLKKIGDLLQVTTDKIHSMVGNQNESDISAAKSTMSALIEERALIEKVSTWPWNPGTIRGFASTLLLPIVLWLITRLLERYF